jgi:predicted dehydrogenase
VSATAAEQRRAGNGRLRRRARVGVIGLGYWGPNLVRVLHELPDTEVAWACDRRRSQLAGIARRYPGVRRTGQVERVLRDRSVDAVAIATPVGTHHELAAAALRAGKHVFVEKPLAASTEEALDLVGLAEEQERVLMPGHTFLYSPPVRAIRDLIGSGELGDLYFVSTSRVNLGLHQPDVSVAWDLGPHDFSILRYWLDESPVRVTAASRSCIFPGTPDVAFITLEFPSGTLAHVELSWLAPSKLRRTAIVGSRKMVVYDDTSTEPVRIFDSGVTMPNPESFGEFRLSYRTGTIVSPPVEATEPLALELADFARAIRCGATPRSSALVGLDVLRVIEAVDRSLRDGGVPVELPTGPRLNGNGNGNGCLQPSQPARLSG